MKTRPMIFALVAMLVAPDAAAEAPARVMIVGTYHMANPGRDLHNVEAVDVLADERQAELERIATALAAFRPTLVAVEWPADVTDERYARYREGTLEPSRNEVVQLGFRLARKVGLEEVHGVDSGGDFPFGAVQQWAKTNGRGDELAEWNATVKAHVETLNRLQQEKTIAETLRYMNTPESVAWGQGTYMELLRLGAGEEQPGAALLESWAGRNYRICAKLLQELERGDRAIVLYGAGHSHYLRRCAIDTPGVELVEPNEYLP